MIISWKYDKSHDYYTITNCNKGPIPRTKLSQLKTKLESQRSSRQVVYLNPPFLRR